MQQTWRAFWLKSPKSAGKIKVGTSLVEFVSTSRQWNLSFASPSNALSSTVKENTVAIKQFLFTFYGFADRNFTYSCKARLNERNKTTKLISNERSERRTILNLIEPKFPVPEYAVYSYSHTGTFCLCPKINRI